MLDSLKPQNGFAETTQVLMQAVLDFYDKNPVASTIVFVCVGLAVPFKIVLNHFYKIKVADNGHLEEKMKIKLELERVKTGQSRR